MRAAHSLARRALVLLLLLANAQTRRLHKKRKMKVRGLSTSRSSGASCQQRLNLHETKIGSIFSSLEPSGTSKTLCVGDGVPKKEITVVICRERYQNVWKWLAAAAFPEAKINVIISDDGDWRALTDKTPDMIMCTCCQGMCFSDDLFKRRSNVLQALQKNGRHLSAQIRSTFDHWNQWEEGVVWATDSTPPAYTNGATSPKWPLMVKYDIEPWGSGECQKFDLNLDVKWNGWEEMHADPPFSVNFRGCPSLLAPWALLHFSHRADKSVSDLLISKSFDATAELAKKKNFAAFVVGNCGEVMDSAIRMAFFGLLNTTYKRVHARSWCYREHNPGGMEGPFRPIAEKYWNAYHVGPIPKGKLSEQPKKENVKDNIVYSFYDGNIRGIQDYKFVVAFENSKRPGYVTEKIVNAKLAHAIPIYWGAPTPFLEKYLNTKAFIHCDIPPSLYQKVPKRKHDQDKHLDPEKRPNIDKYVEELKVAIRSAALPCIKRIQEIDQNDELYKEMISQSLIPNNQIRDSMFDISRLGKKIRRFMQDRDEFV